MIHSCIWVSAFISVLINPSKHSLALCDSLFLFFSQAHPLSLALSHLCLLRLHFFLTLPASFLFSYSVFFLLMFFVFLSFGDIPTFLLYRAVFLSLTPFFPHLLFCADSLSDSKRGMQVLVCSLPSVCVIGVWASVLRAKCVMFVCLCTDTATV